MKTAIDSSAFAKRYVSEVGTDQLFRILQNTTELALCVITIPEITSGLNRRKREGFLSPEDYNLAKKQLLNDVRDATILQITPAVVMQSVKLLESSALRAMDSLHIACALEWKADQFLTSDKKQFEAATKTGIHSAFIGQRIRLDRARNEPRSEPFVGQARPAPSTPDEYIRKYRF